jgi:hypothetical protein
MKALGDAFGRDEALAVVQETIVKIARQQGAALSERMGDNSLNHFVDSPAFQTKDDALENIIIWSNQPQKKWLDNVPLSNILKQGG